MRSWWWGGLGLVACTREAPGPGDSGADSGQTSGADSEDSADPADIPAEELEPPEGPYPGAPGDSPGVRRLLLATSTDGQTFTRKEQVLSDQANTPNLVVLDSGRVLVYYTGSALYQQTKDGVGVAVSDDGGTSWRYFRVAFDGYPDDLPSIGDPDVVQKADGSFRMYVTTGIGAVPGVLVGTSTDGFSFTYEGLVVAQTPTLLDSLTTMIGEVAHMYLLQPDSGQMAHATSTDGVEFAIEPPSQLTIDGAPYVLNNWFEDVDGSRRLFGSSGATNAIRSFTTTDGTALEAVDAVHLAYGGSSLESAWVNDPAVGRLPDGTYLMAYTSEIP